MPDKYTYPGTEILINIPGILDQALLDNAERNIARVRLTELRKAPIPGKFDFPHLQAIHRKLVGDLYSWAGEIRTTDTQARGTGVAHCRPEFIEAFAAEVFAGIAADNFLLHLNHHEFAEKLAYHWGELTSLHPFRDGNTRSQSTFLDQLATAAGWEIHWSKLDLDGVKEARVIAISHSSEPLCNLLSPAITARHQRNQE